MKATLVTCLPECGCLISAQIFRAFKSHNVITPLSRHDVAIKLKPRFASVRNEI